LPGRPPVWFGARSFATTKFFCLDVDSHPCADQILSQEFNVEIMPGDMQTQALAKIRPKLLNDLTKSQFAERCVVVERALRRLGVYAENPRHVLIQASPRGGRHYFVFLDAPYRLDQIYPLLVMAGLRHTKGNVEFFPSTSMGFRLPFGHMPGKEHDLNRWLRFIDDYSHRRIRQFSLKELMDHVDEHRAVQHRRVQAQRSAIAQKQVQPTRPMMGIPRRFQNVPKSTVEAAPSGLTSRYLALVNELGSRAEAEELFALGIRVLGTRTQALKRLAEHLVWFKNLAADQAATLLTEWAMNPRHVSKDIAKDLKTGTKTVELQIGAMCRWCATHKKPRDLFAGPRQFIFSDRELAALSDQLSRSPHANRIMQACFLLHFLRFAKRYGESDFDGQGWRAAVAIRQVIRRWPGCDHMKYKLRISDAILAGSIRVVKDAWHTRNGPGRARTYLIVVPITTTDEWVHTYDAALQRLHIHQLEHASVSIHSHERELAHATHSASTNH
jgi:hypothetical protein